MTNRLLILALFSVLIDFSANAQTNKYSLSKCASAYYGNSNNMPPGQKQAELRDCIVGRQFPAFSATTINGKKYSDADLKGKVVLVTSWFAACPPCIAEIPLLDELNKKYKDDEFLLLSFSADDVGRINKFLKERPITYEIFPGSEELIMHNMQTSYGYPTNIIVNKEKSLNSELELRQIKRDWMQQKVTL
jgi:thiol-disulfide isomerase/thioredoxin